MSKFNSSLGLESISALLSKRGARIHFVGVGGIGMYSLFRLSRTLGYRTTGSDISALRSEAYEGTYIGSRPDAVEDADLVVYSLAVSDRDPECRRAEELGIPLVSRAEYLAWLAEKYNNVISVSGSHGKSTVTALLAAVFFLAGKSPSVISGALLSSSGEPYIDGGHDHMILEACEYKDSFLRLSPDIAVFTNLELDHTDYFRTLDDIKRSFLAAMNRAGKCIVNADDENLADIMESSSSELVCYGIKQGADFRAVDIVENGGKYSFSVIHGGGCTPISLSVIGRHSVYNALAAFAAACTAGLEESVAARAISEFRGIPRRLEYLGSLGEYPIYYDYAHHPTEIRASIEAIRAAYRGKLNVIFRPHTYSRTRDLLSDFAVALEAADRVLLLEIDAVRESLSHDISSSEIACKIGSHAALYSERGLLALLPALDGAVILMGAAGVDGVLNFYLKNVIDKLGRE